MKTKKSMTKNAETTTPQQEESKPVLINESEPLAPIEDTLSTEQAQLETPNEETIMTEENVNEEENEDHFNEQEVLVKEKPKSDLDLELEKMKGMEEDGLLSYIASEFVNMRNKLSILENRIKRKNRPMGMG
jgi:hypothetical protein